MPASLEGLFDPMEAGALRLELVDEPHREGLRAACEADEAIWDIYAYNMRGPDFDRVFDHFLASRDRPFGLLLDGRVIGKSGYLNIAPGREGLEIGGTYMTPETRGTGLNARVKTLMIDRAIACGFRRIEFRVDARNLRSQAAVEKIGGAREGVLRAERITWTGHVRDTVVFSILAEEWRTRSA